MTKKGGGKSWGQGKTVGTIEWISHVPMMTTTIITTSKGSGTSCGAGGSYQMKSRITVGDKKTGSYGKVTTKEKVSGCEFHWKNGTSSVKSSVKKSSTVKVGGKTVGRRIGRISHVPMKTTKGRKGSGTSGGAGGSYQKKSRITVGDKKTGSYRKTTKKEKVSGGEFHWKNGTSGVKSEVKKSSTVKVNDKRGYTEVYKEERVKNVVYDNNKGSGGGGGNGKNLITYGDSDSSGYYECSDSSSYCECSDSSSGSYECSDSSGYY